MEGLWHKVDEITLEYRRKKRNVSLGVEHDNGKTFNFNNEQRALHTFILGKTGTGKTTLMEHMILSDIREGEGVCVIDIHGDLIESLLEKIPPERSKDVLLVDPSREDTEHLNFMEVKTSREKTFFMEELVNLLYNFYDPTRTGIMGPMLEQAVRYSMLAIMNSKRPGTLVDIPELIVSQETRNLFIDEMPASDEKDLVKKWWSEEWEKKNSYQVSEILCYITSKFERFRTNEHFRKILSAGSSSFDIKQSMNEGKILFFRLSKGFLEDLCARFMGTLILIKLFNCALSRSELPYNERKDFYLYIDEFHNFGFDSVKMLVAESRKYRIFLTLATQNLMSLKEDIRESVLGNVSNLILFRSGYPDAQKIAPYILPYYRETDLINLPNYVAITKTAETREQTIPVKIKSIMDETPGRPFKRYECPPIEENEHKESQATQDPSFKLPEKVSLHEIAKMLDFNTVNDVNERNENGESLLHRASQVGDRELVQLLISKGADVNLKTGDGRSSLHIALNTGNSSLTKYLVFKGADVNEVTPTGKTPLHMVGNDEIIAQMFISKGAEVHVKDEFGLTPLRYAIVHGHTRTAKFLRSHGAIE